MRQKFKSKILATTCFLGLIIFIGFGCASNPENIKPSYVSTLRYKKYTCEELLVEHNDLINMYSVAAKEQRNVAAGDVAGVILLGFPVAGSANIDYEIASLKGNILAIRKSLVEKNACDIPPLPKDIARDFITPTKLPEPVYYYRKERFMDFQLR
jgi:hypothetical protein